MIQNRPREHSVHFFGVERWYQCKKQAAVSHSSIESEGISLDVGLRMDGSFALILLDLAIEVLHSSPKAEGAQGNRTRKECETHHEGRTKPKRRTSEDSCFRETGYVTPNVKTFLP